MCDFKRVISVCSDPECMFYSGAEYTMNAYRSATVLYTQQSAVKIFVSLFYIYSQHHFVCIL